MKRAAAQPKTSIPGLLEKPLPPPAPAWRGCDHPGCSAWGSHPYRLPNRPTRSFCAPHLADGEAILRGAR